MLTVMLFEESQVEEKKKKEVIENATAVRKAPAWIVALFPIFFLLLIAGGVFLFLFRPIPQYFATAVCLFAASLAPLFFFLDALIFRLAIGNGRISLRRLMAKEAFYSYTDVSWRMQYPDKKRSAILLFAKGKQIARILPGAPGYPAVTALRHKGTLKDGERAILRSLGTDSK